MEAAGDDLQGVGQRDRHLDTRVSPDRAPTVIWSIHSDSLNDEMSQAESLSPGVGQVCFRWQSTCSPTRRLF